MCKQRDLFYMCGCRFVEETTGEWKSRLEPCDKAKRWRRHCEKPEIALPIFAKDTYCDDPDCPSLR
ncbi:hypothetical protein F4775DRAFT_558671 [Biscogniauxia sp. FL1348]|nr:hypothetical protein F4775DRAFT_558671 [Biscogniauxia sp. FL1348]